jgi:hypothetical protein
MQSAAPGKTRRTCRQPTPTQVIEPHGKRRVRRLRRVFSKVFSAPLSRLPVWVSPAPPPKGKKKRKTPDEPVAPDALPCNSGAYGRRVWGGGVGLELGRIVLGYS